MNKLRTSLGGVAVALAAASAGFSQIPDSIFGRNDSTFRPMWNRTNLNADFMSRSNNWSVVFPGTDSAVIRAAGSQPPGTGGWTNLVWKWAATSAQPNFEVRFSYRMPNNPNGNSGFNFRSRCATGTPATECGGSSAKWVVCGPQFDTGPTFQGDIWNSCANRYAGSGVASNPPNIITNTTACRAGMDLRVWGQYSYKVLSDTAFTYRWIHGFSGQPTLCAKYYLTANTDRAAGSQGLFALQYETTETSEFRNIVIRNLTPQPVPVLPMGRSRVSHSLAGAEKAILFGIREAGAYSVEVRDLRGGEVKRHVGEGPVVRRSLSLARSGAYVVNIRTAKGASSGKVVVF